MLSQVYTWPTKAGWTLENATEYCRNYMLLSASGAACVDQVADVNLEATLNGCVDDIQVGLVSTSSLDSYKYNCTLQRVAVCGGKQRFLTP